MDMEFCIQLVLRALLSVIVGAVIGGERERHGRAAGMRTHILVCLGAAFTALISIYVNNSFAIEGDVARLPAQVVSGIGFLGAGMIILKNDNMISGLTTAAGVWTTGILGIAIGYGFYLGAVLGAALFLVTTALLTRFEKRKKKMLGLYIEIDNMYNTNKIIDELRSLLGRQIEYSIMPPVSGYSGNLGISVVVDKKQSVDIKKICDLENVVYVKDELKNKTERLI